MAVTLYSKPNCVQCDATKREMNKKGIEYDVVDISEDMNALTLIKDMGFLQAPVVITGDDKWSGFRPDKIKTLVAPALA